MTQPNIFPKGLTNLSTAPPNKSRLHELFGLPPFSVWNSREGWWQHRRDVWLGLGIESELGRKDGLTYAIPATLSDGSKGRKIETQTSIFDPVLCETIYRFWSPTEGQVVDPFAGGSVRGIVASHFAMRYWGCDLRAEQVAANQAQATRERCGAYKPRWVTGDSRVTLRDAPPADFLFSCPPYGNLEQYSDDPADLSNKDYATFLELYREIISLGVELLRPDRFACFVVGNYRNPKTGHMYNLVGDTIQAFADAGMPLWNDIILVNCVGSGAMRTNGTFIRGNRKVVKLHQNVLVFIKGSPEKAAEKAAKQGEVVAPE